VVRESRIEHPDELLRIWPRGIVPSQMPYQLPAYMLIIMVVDDQQLA
jgi:hypothetical protein